MNTPNLPLPALPSGSKIPMVVALVAITFMCGAYLLFLWASWQQYQADRRLRDDRINDLLEKLPKQTQPAE